MIVPFGDHALRFALPSPRDHRALLATLRSLPGVADVVLTETTGAVVALPSASLPSLASALALALAPAPAPAPGPAPAVHTIPVLYDGPDLDSVASSIDLSVPELIALHTAPTYDVALLGFLPGFAYLRNLDPRLHLPRRESPRTRVPAGSVGIAAGYTGIYPFASPGGWHLLGRALAPALFDARGARFALGDRVRFEPVLAAPTPTPTATPTPTPTLTGPRLEVLRAVGPVLVVDAGRIGHMHEGVPHGGALVPEALVAANRAAQNDDADHAAALEIYGVLEVVARGGAIVLGDDTGRRTVLAEGETLALATEGKTRVRVLAVRGGIDVPVVLGGRGLIVGTEVGGHHGRGVRRGDVIVPKIVHVHVDVHVHVHVHDGRGIDVLAGPDDDPALREAINAATFAIGPSDRIGTRLIGPPLPAHCMQNAHNRPSMPMVRGAIEVTPQGLVVLGPDHPTTGGYPVIGVVRSAAIGFLFRRPPGATVRLAISTQKRE